MIAMASNGEGLALFGLFFMLASWLMRSEWWLRDQYARRQAIPTWLGGRYIDRETHDAGFRLLSRYVRWIGFGFLASSVVFLILER